MFSSGFFVPPLHAQSAVIANTRRRMQANAFFIFAPSPLFQWNLCNFTPPYYTAREKNASVFQFPGGDAPASRPPRGVLSDDLLLFCGGRAALLQDYGLKSKFSLPGRSAILPTVENKVISRFRGSWQVKVLTL